MYRRIFLILFVGLLVTSCGSSKKTSRNYKKPEKRERRVMTKGKADSRKEKEVEVAPAKDPLDNGVNPIPKDGVSVYVDTYSEIAKEEMLQYGIPASITLAQGILESGAGKGELVRKANNHFGIKCHDWKGATVSHDDDSKGECFRKYSLAKFSYRDHSLFLTNRKRYTDLFKLPKDDYKGWAKGLRAAGYATDKKYPAKLISLIERYQLYRYDGEVLGKSESDYTRVTDQLDQHTVQKGETLYRLSKKYNLTVEMLKEINGLESNEIFEGQVLYIKPLSKGY
ncbi:LysM peptidoglycan-binding domain-containing protein [Dokdonia sinensis]|uniref:Peptidoglycan hydrolase n=1 Tax=Dokdonia sinensis TaxID=2479847 RepID=A0A3M0GEK8_9FLAO|nr:glucosaminidase domain-containing protein [Dokdonia sinensis]RMB62927.1 LysM peptidoglycan-binding domain-containing protein [Dokdonia sinensis]